jgi:peptidoglycan L-alanyl-D-glutamate endopeptidase CwlK
MIFHFSQSSLNKLITVDNRLQILAIKVLEGSPIDFAITSGLRTKEEQIELYKKGKSKCDGINIISKHQIGKAIDICPCIDGKLDYTAIEDLFFIMGLFCAKADELRERWDNTGGKEGLDITIRTGALWDGNSIRNNRFVDGYHVEIV